MWQKTLTLLPNLSGCILRNLTSKRYLSVSQVSFLNQKWRKERGLTLNPNATGVLTDSPDYSFLDGRPTPYGMRQIKRIFKQREYAEKIIRLTSEIDFAVDRHNKLQQKERDNRQQILDNKLRPKGIELLKKKKNK